MHGDKLADDFDSWVSNYGCIVMGLKFFRHEDEVLWQVIIGHEDFRIQTSTIAEVEKFFEKSKSEGFSFQVWRKFLKDSLGHIVGELIMFAYNG